MVIASDIQTLKRLLSQQVGSSNELFTAVEKLADIALQIAESDPTRADAILNQAKLILNTAHTIKSSAHEVSNVVKAA